MSASVLKQLLLNARTTGNADRIIVSIIIIIALMLYAYFLSRPATVATLAAPTAAQELTRQSVRTNTAQTS
jgi:hypothetical protein